LILLDLSIFFLFFISCLDISKSYGGFYKRCGFKLGLKKHKESFVNALYETTNRKRKLWSEEESLKELFF